MNPPSSSPFDPRLQRDDRDARIVAALERLSQAFRVMLWSEGQPRGLSPVQIRILEHLRYQGPTLRRVGELAREFDLTPATVSDAVSTLQHKGLLRKARSPEDGRVWILDLTREGMALADTLSGWARAFQDGVAVLPEEEKTGTLHFLLGLIERLHREGAITEARMCLTCRFFGEGEGPDPAHPHFCHLLERPLETGDLRLDCPEHEAAAGGVR